MAVCCRTLNVKPLCANYLFSSIKNNHYLDSRKLYYHINDTCSSHGTKEYVNSSVVVPLSKNGDQNLQPFFNLSSNKSLCDTSLQLHFSAFLSNKLPSCDLSSRESYLALLSEFEKQTVLSDGDNTEEKSNAANQSDSPPGRPSSEQVKNIFNFLSHFLPIFFTEPLDYNYFAKDVVVEDNISGVRTVGMYLFIKKAAILRTLGHLKFAYLKLEVLKITSHPEEGCVKVRWRVSGLSAIKAFFQFWKVRLWDYGKSMSKEEEMWFDGFSVFYVNSDGKVQKITIDKMMPDEENKTAKTDKLPLAARLAVLGLVPENLGTLVMTDSTHSTTDLHNLILQMFG